MAFVVVIVVVGAGGLGAFAAFLPPRFWGLAVDFGALFLSVIWLGVLEDAAFGSLGFLLPPQSSDKLFTPFTAAAFLLVFAAVQLLDFEEDEERDTTRAAAGRGRTLPPKNEVREDCIA